MKKVLFILMMYSQFTFAGPVEDATVLGNNCSLIAGRLLIASHGGQRYYESRQESVSFYTAITKKTGMPSRYVNIAVNTTYDVTRKSDSKISATKEELELAQKMARAKCELEYYTSM